MQFIVGASFALIHLFVSYTVPVSVPYEVIDKVVQSATTSTVTSIVSSATNTAALPTATAAAIAFLKKLVYRAAGEEGLAENIYQPTGESQYAQYAHGLADEVQQVLHRNPVKRTVYRTEYQHVPCIDTSGQAFAIYLNLIYLLPLTGLFMRFFVKSYLRRTSANAKPSTTRDAIVNAGRDAIHGVDRELESLGRSAEDGDSTSSGSQHAKGSARGRTVKQSDIRNGSLSPANQKFVDSIAMNVSQRLEAMGEGAKDTKERAKKIAKEVVSGIESPNSERAFSPEKKSVNGNGDSDKSGNEAGDEREKADGSKAKAEGSKDKAETSKGTQQKDAEKSKIPKKSKDTKGQDAEKKDTEQQDTTEEVNYTEVRAQMVSNTNGNGNGKPPGAGKVTAKPSEDDKTNGEA